MKNIKCYKCGAILAVPDSTQETTCTACGAKLRLAPPAPAPAPVQAPTPVTQGAAPVPAPVQQAPAAAALFDPHIPSYFDGKLWQYIGVNIVFTLQCITVIGIPWAIIRKKKWVLKHTIVRGQRLKLTARGSQLIGSFIKWGLLTVITCFIYGFWVPIKYQQWYASHLEFDGDPIPPYELPRHAKKRMEKEKEKAAKKAEKEMKKAAK